MMFSLTTSPQKENPSKVIVGWIKRSSICFLLALFHRAEYVATSPGVTDEVSDGNGVGHCHTNEEASCVVVDDGREWFRASS